MDSEPPPARLPIVVGVTGHRDLLLEPKDPGLLAPRHAVERELRAILDAFPHSPVIVLSGLAEGADSLVAEVVLALAQERRGTGSSTAARIELVAVLPLPLEICALDYYRAEHLAVAQQLQEQAARTLELWSVADLNSAGRDVERQRARLKQGYAQLGAYLARNCHLLLALWNGKAKPAGTLGGTADVVSWFEQGVPAEHLAEGATPNPLRVPDGLRCVRVPCARLSDAECRALDFARVEREAEAANTVLRQIDEFNEDAARAEAAGPLPETDLGQALDEVQGPGRACVQAYAAVQRVADRLAMQFKFARRRAIQRLFAWAAVAIVGFEFFSHGPFHVAAHFALLLAYVLAFAASVVLILRAQRRRLEAKFLVYRSLAEALRVQCVWGAIGLTDRADDAYDVLHRDAIAWVRQGLKGLHVVGTPCPAPRLHGLGGVRWARESWIEGQIRYFRHEVHRTHAAHERSRRWALALAGVGLALACWYSLLLACGGGYRHDGSGFSHDLHGSIVIAMALLVAGGGFCRAWATRVAYEATLERYRIAGDVFARAATAVDLALASGDAQTAQAVVQALGREALMENAGWVLLHRDHPLEIVAGG